MADNYARSKLLTIPSSSNGLSAYNPSFGSVILNAADLKQRRAVENDSPPRKTARLEGDIDHFASRSRTKDKGKGKEPSTGSTSLKTTEKKLTLVGLPLNILEEEYLSKLGPLVERAIRSVLARPGTTAQKQRPFPATYEDVYQAMRTIVLLTDGGHVTYKVLQRELEETAGSISEFLSNSQHANQVDWLEELINTHSWYERSVHLLESLLAFLDHTFLEQKPDLKHIRELATETFTLRVFGRVKIVSKIKESINDWIQHERDERQPHPKRHVMLAFVNALQTHNLFSSIFLEIYVSLTEAYYAAESEILAKELEKNPGEFIRRIEERLTEEEERARSVLSSFRWCWKDLKHTVEKSLLDNRLDWLRLNIGPAVDEENVDGLKRMYNLFASVGGLKTLCDAFKAHVQKRVEDIVNDTEHDEDMVDRLLHFKGFIDSAITAAFFDEAVVEQKSSDNAEDVERKPGDQPQARAKTGEVNRDFLYAARDAFQTGFRIRRNKPAEMIAKFIDRAMRRGQKDASDEEFSKLLDNVLGLYRFTQDKDVFRTFYHRALAKRLLSHRSASDDFEKSVLKKLKDNYDPEFSMGDHMFRDLALSRDIMEEFHNKPIGQGSAEKLNVMVLQRSFWPFSARTNDDILLPVDMQSDLTKFTAFYKNAHQGHKLDFDHSLGTVQMWARFDKGRKDLSLSLYQADVLLLFNNSDELSYEDIQQSTRMVEDDLKRTLQSLACAREKVLRKRPVGKDVNNTDVFVFNPSYWHEKVRVHINQIQAKETPEETKKTHEAIEGDRRHYLDAAIVRVMKAKKTVGHNQLVNDTIDAVKNHFKPEAKDIKHRIEQLIEQEYIRRDDDSPNTYVYVA